MAAIAIFTLELTKICEKNCDNMWKTIRLNTRDDSDSTNRFGRLFAVCALMCLGYFAFLTGTRDISFGTDTAIYSAIYLQIRSCSCMAEGIEPIFSSINLLIGLLEISPSGYLCIISATQFLLLLLLSSVLGQSNFSTERIKNFQVLFVAISIASPFYFNGQINLIRQGLSAPLVILAAIAIIQKRWVAVAFLCVVSIGIHYSSVLYLAAFVLLRFSLRSLYLIFVLSSIAYLTGLSEYGIQWISDILALPAYSFFKDYGVDADYGRGVRYDFFVFSLTPLVWITAANKIFPSLVATNRSEPMEKIYILLLLPFLALGWGSFSDRYLFDAWIFAPVLFALPLVRFIARRMFFIAVGVALASCSVYFYYLNAAEIF